MQNNNVSRHLFRKGYMEHFNVILLVEDNGLDTEYTMNGTFIFRSTEISTKATRLGWKKSIETQSAFAICIVVAYSMLSV